MTSRAPYPYEPPHDEGSGHGGQEPGPGGPRRSRGRTFVPLAMAAWALLEIWLLIVIGETAGGLAVLALLVAGFLLGVYVIKRAGRRAWSRLAESVQQAQRAAQTGQAPPESTERHGGGNALTMLGGLLIMVPGVVSDVAGLLCLFPPTAALMRRTTRRYLDRRSGFAPGTVGDAYQQARKAEEQMRMHKPDGKVVEGEVVRDDEPPGR
ncbi:FxsA family protein [Streptomyces sp. HNM0575]|uniref:FxsA family membrane protein n=1 Tax=Streptomyces sp. HNM0575 TaxID=2716338 RepID=UPI00145C6F61|nr:FxsA family membrane protein [Streptomyces sp. HNM0575]NLU76648.1 FxsA family protein [Streptomyces sp. HNM0575]